MRNTGRFLAKALLAGVVVTAAWGAFDKLLASEIRSRKTSSFFITDNGRATGTIVTASNADKIEKYAAVELQNYIYKISGVKLPVRHDNEEIKGNKILVGNSRLTRALDIDTSSLNKDGFIIRSVGKTLILTGGSPLGTLYGVYDFLESLGCRFFTPDDEVIPGLKNIEIKKINIEENPDFEIRWVASGRWAVKNKMNVNLGKIEGKDIGKDMYACHTFGRLLPPGKYYKKHPEFYALVNGKRKGGHKDLVHLCLSNPEAVKETVSNLKKVFAENPGLDSYLLMPGDGLGFCECPDCRALDDQSYKYDGIIDHDTGKMSARVMNFYNKVARKIYETYPTKIIDIGAYSCYTEAPGNIKPYKNIRVLLAHYGYCYTHAMEDPNCKYNQEFRKTLEKWLSVSPHGVWIYEYYWKCNWRSLFWPIIPTIRKDIPYFKKLGIKGLLTQCSNTWVTQGPVYYVTAKLLWDSSADVNKLLDDYFNKFYGKAGPAIKKVFSTFEKRMQNSGCIYGDAFGNALRLFTPEVMDQCRKYLKEAEKLAADSEIIRKRVKKMITVFAYNTAFVEALRQESLSSETQTAKEQKQCLSKAVSYWKNAIAIARANKKLFPPPKYFEPHIEKRIKRIEKLISSDLSEDEISKLVFRPANENTVLLLHFDEKNGRLAKDSSAYGNDGIVKGKVADSDWVCGKSGNALHFSSDSFVKCGNLPALKNSGLTIEAWIKKGDDTDMNIAKKWLASKNQRSWSLCLSKGGIGGAVSCDGTYNPGQYMSFSCPFKIGPDWTHFAVCYDGKEIKIYINGKLRRSIPWTKGIYAGNADLEIGHGVIFNKNFNGSIDEFRVSNKAVDFEKMASSCLEEKVGSPQKNILSEIAARIPALNAEDGIIYVKQQCFNTTHKDPLKLYLNNNEIINQKKNSSGMLSEIFTFKKNYIQKADIAVPSAPYISISFLQESERKTIYTKIQGKLGGACALYILLPEGIKVDGIKTEQWEEGLCQDCTKVDKIGNRYLLYLRSEWGNGEDICIAELK